MDLNLSPSDVQFQDRVRSLLAAHLPADMRERGLAGHAFPAADIRRWQEILHSHGWGAVHWPLRSGPGLDILFSPGMPVVWTQIDVGTETEHRDDAVEIRNAQAEIDLGL